MTNPVYPGNPLYGFFPRKTARGGIGARAFARVVDAAAALCLTSPVLQLD
jgi:hypothetical protein